MIVPLQWFIENPFENWTPPGSNILGTVFLYVDYATPIEPIRAEAKRLVESYPEWDGRVFAVQVTDATDKAIQVRVLLSSASSAELRPALQMREALVAFVGASTRLRCRWRATSTTPGGGDQRSGADLIRLRWTRRTPR